MQVSLESTGPLERTLRVEVPEDRIAAEVKNRLQNLSRTTRVKGFRPGKVPIKVIEQRFGERVRQEVVGEVVRESFYEAIQKENLQPVGDPTIDPLDAGHGEGLKYAAHFEVLPEIELADVAKLEPEKPVCEIGDADVETMIEVLRKQRRRFEEVQRESRSGDQVEINFAGTIDGKPFPGGEGSGMPVELGAGRLMDGFEEGLEGKKAGEKLELSLQFPDNFHDEELRGKPVKFDVEVTKVSEPVLPELDEAFFKEFGVGEGGEQAFRREVREHMDREVEAVIRNRLKESVMEVLYQANSVTLPGALVQRERRNLREQFERTLKAQGIGIEAAREKLDDPKLFEEQARKRVALQLLVGEIIRKNELRADPAKVRARIEKSAQGYEDPSAIINWYYSDQNRLAEIEALALEDEVVDWIADRAAVREHEVPFDELMNKGQTDPV